MSPEIITNDQLVSILFQCWEGKIRAQKTKLKKIQEPTNEKPIFYTLNGCLKNFKLFGSFTSLMPKCWDLYIRQAWADVELLACLGTNSDLLGSNQDGRTKHLSNYFVDMIPLLPISKTVHRFFPIEVKVCIIPDKSESSYIHGWLIELPQ